MPLAIGFVTGGALGNALDRVTYGAVADFLNTSCCGIRNPYSFNIADIFIFVGAGLLLLFSSRTD
jgi:signal peptidase II